MNRKELIEEALEYTAGWNTTGDAVRYKPFDQGDWIPDWSVREWRTLPQARIDARNAGIASWEAAHNHDVRLRCFPEYGCIVIESYSAYLIQGLLLELKKGR